MTLIAPRPGPLGALARILLTLAGVIAADPATADAEAGADLAGIDLAGIDAWVEARMVDERIPGAAVVVVRGGQVVHLRGYGAADASGRPVDGQTPFLIGSVSKSFTALAVARLAEQGLVELDRPVQAYLPWFRTADRESSARITLRQLLTHTSGFSTLDGNRHRLAMSIAGDALQQRVRRLAGARPVAPPGERFEYSNANYQTLGALIEAVAGQTYEEHLVAQVLRPLGMQGDVASTPTRTPADLAAGHRYWFGRPVATHPREADRQIGPQGLVVASAEDMGRYLLFNLGHGPDGVLSPEGLAAMHEPGEFRYGMGWMVGERHGTRYVGHGGQNPGFFAFVLFSPARDEGVAVLTNAADLIGRRGAEGIGLGVIDLLAGQAPALRPASPIPRIVLVGTTALVLLVLASIALTRRRLGQWRRGERAPPVGRAARLLRVLPQLAVFGAAAWVLLVKLWTGFGATLGAGLLFAPDLAWLCLVAGVLVASWGLLRAVLLLRAFAAYDALPK